MSTQETSLNSVAGVDSLDQLLDSAGQICSVVMTSGKMQRGREELKELIDQGIH